MGKLPSNKRWNQAAFESLISRQRQSDNEGFVIINAKKHYHNHFEVLVDNAETTCMVERSYFDNNLLDRIRYEGYFFVTGTKSNKKLNILDQIEAANLKR